MNFSGHSSVRKTVVNSQEITFLFPNNNCWSHKNKSLCIHFEVLHRARKRTLLMIRTTVQLKSAVNNTGSIN